MLTKRKSTISFQNKSFARNVSLTYRSIGQIENGNIDSLLRKSQGIPKVIKTHPQGTMGNCGSMVPWILDM